MFRRLLDFFEGVSNSSVVALGSQIFQVGIIGTAGFFLGNLARTLQNNILNIIMAKIAGA